MSRLSPEFILKHKGEPVTDLNFWKTDQAFDENDCLLSAYHKSGGVDLWDLKTRRVMINIPAIDQTSVISVCGINNKKIISLDKEGHLRVTAFDNGGTTDITNLVVPNVAFCKAAILPQTNCFDDPVVGVPGQEKSSFNIWNLNHSKIMRRLIPHEECNLGMPMCAKLFHLNGIQALVGYEDGSVLLWDVEDGKAISAAKHIFPEPVMCLDFCTEDLCGIAGSATTLVVKWKVPSVSELKNDSDETVNLKTLQHLHGFEIMKNVELLNAGVSCVKVRSDRKIFVTGGWDHKTRVFSWKTTKPLAVLDYHKGTIQSAAFADSSDPKKQVLACGSNDCKISIWRIYND